MKIMSNNHHRLIKENEDDRLQVSFTFNGQRLYGRENESIAAALLANGIQTIRIDENTGEPRGIYCGIGHCYECRAEVNQIANVRTCITPLIEGTEVSTNFKRRRSINDN